MNDVFVRGNFDSIASEIIDGLEELERGNKTGAKSALHRAMDLAAQAGIHVGPQWQDLERRLGV